MFVERGCWGGGNRDYLHSMGAAQASASKKVPAIWYVLRLHCVHLSADVPLKKLVMVEQERSLSICMLYWLIRRTFVKRTALFVAAEKSILNNTNNNKVEQKEKAFNKLNKSK